MHASRFLVALALLASASMFGCSGDDDVPAETAAVAVGALSDSGGFVSVVSDPTRFVGYICDGASVAAFFSGPVTDGSFSVTSPVGTFAGEVESGAVVGTFTPPGGMEEAFSGAVVGSQAAGIWQAFPDGESGDLVAGWVVDAAGAQRGATVNRTTGAVVANPMLDVSAGTANIAGSAIAAARIEGPDGYINAYNFGR